MKLPDPFGVAVLGLGRIGPAHAKIAFESPHTELKALAEANPDRLKEISDGFPKVARTTDYTESLERDDVQIAIICLPHWLHRDGAVAAAKAGKHVFIEKPLACTVSECDEILQAAADNHVTIMPAHTQRFIPHIMKVKEILESKDLGEPVMAIDYWHKPFRLETRPKWMLSSETGGGMALMDGTHMIDRLLWFFGPDVESVTGMEANLAFPNVDADDTSMALLRWENGFLATISRQAYQTGVTRFGGDITCTRGQIKFRLPYGKDGENGVWIGRHEKFTPVELDSTRQPLEREFDAFCTALKNGNPPCISGAHGRQVIEITEAITHSSKSGREVMLSKQFDGPCTTQRT